MDTRRTLARSTPAALLVLLVWASQAAGQAPPGIRIDNFGRINDHYYRGAQPKGGDYADLAALGVKTVIDLTRDGEDIEQRRVEAAGMRFHRIPMTTWDRPSEAAAAEFLKLVTDPANLPVYVHCQGGRHRTGAMTALYRITQDGWTADQAYAEMKKFRFEGFPGHPELKKFVYDTYAQLQQRSSRGGVLLHGAEPGPIEKTLDIGPEAR
jgi:tyrosine-protein phosphatase SIW14